MTPKELIEEVERVHLKINQQIQNRRSDIPGPGTLDELVIISREFADLTNRLTKNIIPPENQRWLSSAQIVTGTWDFEEELGEEICRINYLYRHELNQS